MGDGKGRKDFIDNESIWASSSGIGLENYGGILAPIQGIYQGPQQPKVSPNFTPFFSSLIGSVYTDALDEIGEAVVINVAHAVGGGVEVHAVNDLTHRIRPCLNGRTSCQAFFVSTDKPVFTKWERRGIYDWVMERVERILSTMNQSGQAVR